MAKKKVAKKAAKKAAVKKAAKKTVKKAVKKTAKKAAKVAKKAPVKKTAKKAAKKSVKKVAKKAAVKKVAAKKAPAKKALKKSANRATATPVSRKKVKTDSDKDTKAADADAIAPPVVIRKFVKPDKPAKLSAFEQKQKQKLIELRDQLMDTVYGMQQATREAVNDSDASGSGEHQGDAGADAYDRDFALNLLAQEQNALEEIEGALQRLDLGTYGICEISKEPIPKARLEAIPFARLTVECQAKWEEENGHRRFQTEGFGFN